MTVPSFELWGIHFHDPMAFLLNWVLMIQAGKYFIGLKKWRYSSLSINWRWFFLFFTISTFFGGIGHLFYEYLGISGKIPGWIAAIFAVTCMEMAMISMAKSKVKTLLKILIMAKLATTLIVLSVFFNFNVVIVHTSAMGIFLLVPSINWMIQGRNELNYFFVGALALISSLPFKLMAIDFHLWFNRNDIGHIFMLIAAYYFYKGVKVYEVSVKPMPEPVV